jgi:NAD(P)-dependent dehydrogenase (short-subunit alcohol dehydrogenase family)
MMNYTKINHSAPYASISPTRASLSVAGKTVLIAGASSGIAQATARAFLEAGCVRLALVSRRVELLSLAPLASSFPNAKILTFAADILDGAALSVAFAGFGSVSIDVVVNCAGYSPTLGPLAAPAAANNNNEGGRKKADLDLADWWRGFEVNVLGAATLARVVASHATPEAVVLQLGTAGALFPAGQQLPMSGYVASKLALVKVMEYFGAENPRLRVVTVHPGIVPETEGGQKMVRESGVEWPGDDSKSHAFISLFLSGRASFC